MFKDPPGYPDRICRPRRCVYKGFSFIELVFQKDGFHVDMERKKGKEDEVALNLSEKSGSETLEKTFPRLFSKE